MLLEYKIQIYDGLQNLSTVDETKNYGVFLFSHEVTAEDVPNTPEKTRVSISGVVKEVNYLREKHY